jgi:hypothetical protein
MDLRGKVAHIHNLYIHLGMSCNVWHCSPINHYSGYECQFPTFGVSRALLVLPPGLVRQYGELHLLDYSSGLTSVRDRRDLRFLSFAGAGLRPAPLRSAFGSETQERARALGKANRIAGRGTAARMKSTRWAAALPCPGLPVTRPGRGASRLLWVGDRRLCALGQRSAGFLQILMALVSRPGASSSSPSPPAR